MAITEVQNNFTGGAAIDPYRANRDEFELSKNVDIYYQTGRVRSYRDVDGYSGGQSDVARIVRTTDGFLNGLTDGTISLYNDDAGAPWNLLVNTGRSLNAGGLPVDEVPMMFELADGASNYLYWWSNIDGTTVPTQISIDIDRYELNSGTYTAAWAQFVIGAPATALIFDEPGPGYTHPLTNRAFFALGNEVYFLEKNSDTLIPDAGFLRPALGTQVPDEYRIVSFSYWESYLVIGCTAKNGGTDKVYFWDQRNAESDFVKEIPEGQLNTIRNTGGQLTCIATQKDVDGLLLGYTYSGGEFILQQSLISRNITGDIKFRDAAADVKNNTLFFGGIFDDKIGIWRFGLNKFGRYSMTIDRGANDDGDETDVLSVEIEGDTFTTVYDNPGTISRTENSADYDLDTNDVDSNDGCFLVTRRYFADQKHLKKELLSLGVATLSPFDETFTPATQTLDVYFRTDANQTWTQIGTHDAAAQEFTEFNFQEHVDTAAKNLQPYYYIQFKFVFTGLVQLSEVTVKHTIEPQTNL